MFNPDPEMLNDSYGGLSSSNLDGSSRASTRTWGGGLANHPLGVSSRAGRPNTDLAMMKEDPSEYAGLD